MLELILALLQRIYCKEKFFSNSSINFFIFYLLGYFNFVNTKDCNDFCQNLRSNYLGYIEDAAKVNGLEIGEINII
jgi:hypothetical protein